MATLEKMPGHPRLYRRNATYYHRAAIPTDIAATYPKSEETFSLRTKDYGEAVRLVRIAAAEVDRKFEDHRQRLERPTVRELTPEQLRHIQSVYYRSRLEEDGEVRVDGFSGYTTAKSFDAAIELHEVLLADTRRQYARGEADDFILGEAKDVLSWDGVDIDLDPASPSWRVLVRSLQEADIRASEAIRKRFDGEVVDTPEEIQKSPKNSDLGPLLNELFESRKEEAQRTGEWSPKLIDDYQLWTDAFIELQGNRPILDYKKADARAFKELLVGLPSNRNKHALTKGLSLADAAAVAEKHALQTLSVSTINKALGRLQATWKWADRQLDEHIPDIFGAMKLKSHTSAREEADPFSVTQLNAIFNGPLFTGCKSERFRTVPGNTDMRRTSWYWLPLLGLWTGARLNELCQLRVDDISEEGGIPFMRLHEGDETQRTKGHTKRIVPLHPELIRLGFVEYVQFQKLSEEERVFSKLKLSAKGYYSDTSSKDFARYLTQLKIKTPKTSFHSFRHNFKDACRHVGVSSDTNDILLGHALSGMAGRYGDGKIPLQLLYEEICKVDHTVLTLSHIRKFSYP